MNRIGSESDWATVINLDDNEIKVVTQQQQQQEFWQAYKHSAVTVNNKCDQPTQT